MKRMKRLKKLMVLVLSLALVFALAGCGGKEKLTLLKVQELAEKGEDLTWSDFEDYEYTDVGSKWGIYVYQFPIDKDYTLAVGGMSLDEKPTSVQLYYNIDGGVSVAEYIDIRTESVYDFINSHNK